MFSKTAGFRHDSIPQGIAAVQAIGQANGFAVDATEDAGRFTAANLAQYKAVVWLSTTGDVLNDAQQTAFEGYIRAGGGYVGVHAAADTEYSWPWYGELVGAYFNSHPANQNAKVDVIDRAHPSTSHLQAAWTRYDEWYNYRSSPRQKCTSWPSSTRAPTRPAAARWATTTRSRGAGPSTAAARGTRAWATRRSPTPTARSAATSPAASCGPRGWRAATARSTSPSRARPTSDEFEGARSAASGRSCARTPSKYAVGGGALKITTENGDLYGRRRETRRT